MIQVPQAPIANSSKLADAASRETPRFRDMRLRKHADYQCVYQATRKQFSNSMTWFVAARPETGGDADESSPTATLASPLPSGPRVGLTAGKVLGKAHERNRIKRRLRELVRRHIHELPEGADLILHPKRSVMTMDFGKLDGEVLRIFRQAAAQIRATRTGAGKAKAGA